MKQTDEYKLCSLEEAEAFAQKRADYIKHLEEGLESSLALNKAQAEKISNMEIWEKKYLDRIAELEKDLEGCEYFLKAQTKPCEPLCKPSVCNCVKEEK